MPVKDTLHDETQMLQRGSVPVPDPTKLTTDAVKALEEKMLALFETKLVSVDKELARLAAALEKRPEAIVVEIGHLNDLVNEKLKAVHEQFVNRDRAIEAALAAQKESVREQNKANSEASEKSETSFEKRIESLTNLMSNQTKATDDKIGSLRDQLTNNLGDLKDRITAAESVKTGSGDTVKWIFAGLTVLGVITVLITFSFSLRQPAPPLVIEKSVTTTP